ncbi:iron-sulfur cluster assembly scaffold protein [Candidatus Dependentiae bacterium]|nr:iron-sulfur cluster assembly scaffold protein [Candidatus Dependentiae bacterium]
MSSLYHDELIEHYKKSPHRKVITNPSTFYGELNPSCGDKIEVMLVINNNVITDIGFQGSGCVISQAAISMLCDTVLGKNIDAALKLGHDEVLQLINIELGPVRSKCALLGLQVLQQSIISWQKK